VGEPKRFQGLPDKRLFEEFTNWPGDPASILRFTWRFGPLHAKAEPGSKFRFRCDEWRDDQEGFRFLWELVHYEPPLQASDSWGKTTSQGFDEVVRFDGAGGWRLITSANDKWEYVDGALLYSTANLFRFMLFEMLAIPRERLRRCARPDCPHPFFVAVHLKQNYCSGPCAAWAQREWKRQWWADQGKQCRSRRRRSASKGGKRGTRKTQ